MNVAKTMQKFLPPGSLIIADHPPETTIEEIDQYDDSYRFDKDDEDAELHATDDDLEGNEMDDQIANEDEEGAEGAVGVEEGAASENNESEEINPEPEDEKANPFEKKWPWGLNDRNAFKKSNFQGLRSNSLIQNR